MKIKIKKRRKDDYKSYPEREDDDPFARIPNEYNQVNDTIWPTTLSTLSMSM